MSAVRRALEFILEKFRKDEAQGYRSRDRQFAIEIAEQALKAEPLPPHDQTAEDQARNLLRGLGAEAPEQGQWSSGDLVELANLFAENRRLQVARIGDSETIGRLMSEKAALEAAVRAHRDARGDDRCWLDDEALYAALPEGYTPPVRDTLVELELCKQFIACRHNPATTYVSPQRRIEELQAALRKIVDDLGHVRDEEEQPPLVVALRRWSECINVAKEALGE
jgi:hypothetical protein